MELKPATYSASAPAATRAGAPGGSIVHAQEEGIDPEFGPASAGIAAPAASARVPWRRMAAIAARDALIILLLVAAAELALRIMAPQYGHNLYDDKFTGGFPVVFNTDGYRGPACPLAKLPGELRVLSLGDSTTFGTGVAAEDTWPMQLAGLLKSRQPTRPVNVINAALQGTGLADMTVGYEQKWADYKPDVITCAISGNMVSLAWISRNDAKHKIPAYVTHVRQETGLSAIKTRVSRAYGRLCLPQFLSINAQRVLYGIGVLDHSITPSMPLGAMLAHGWLQGGLPPNEADAAWNCFGKELADLKAAADAHGARLIVTFVPSRFDLSDSFWDDEKFVPKRRLTIDPTNKLSDLCGGLGISFLDAKSALLEEREQIAEREHRAAAMYVMFDYTHLNRDGHAALAGAMASEIQTGH